MNTIDLDFARETFTAAVLRALGVSSRTQAVIEARSLALPAAETVRP